MKISYAQTTTQSASVAYNCKWDTQAIRAYTCVAYVRIV